MYDKNLVTSIKCLKLLKHTKYLFDFTQGQSFYLFT
jgi:hypothetical protein